MASVEITPSCYQGAFIPDGIVCWSDVYAIATMQFLYKRHIKVPEETAVVGYDDFLASYSTIPSPLCGRLSLSWPGRL